MCVLLCFNQFDQFENPWDGTFVRWTNIHWIVSPSHKFIFHFSFDFTVSLSPWPLELYFLQNINWSMGGFVHLSFLPEQDYRRILFCIRPVVVLRSDKNLGDRLAATDRDHLNQKIKILESSQTWPHKSFQRLKHIDQRGKIADNGR